MKYLFHLSLGWDGFNLSAKPPPDPWLGAKKDRRTEHRPTNFYLLTRFLKSPVRYRSPAPGEDEPAFNFQMLTSSPSPTLHPCSPRHVYTRSSRLVNSLSSAAVRRRRSAPTTPLEMSTRRSQSSSLTTRNTSDASTQYSPPNMEVSPGKVAQEVQWEQTEVEANNLHPEPPEPRLAPQSHLSNPARQSGNQKQIFPASHPTKSPSTATPSASSTAQPIPPSSTSTATAAATATASSSSTAVNNTPSTQPSPTKRARHSSTSTAPKQMPLRYQSCDPSDLVKLIASMLMELISHNDNMPLASGGLTRFHSRAPPGISVQDYLQRLTTHATLSPPILLSMVYYIDRLCALWPRFTINSLTVHRYLIASATVASKGLSDSFWTNSTYARVGGVSVRELALLELEFVQRIDWRIVPKPEVLVDYYKSLVERCEGFELAAESPTRLAGGKKEGRRGSRTSGNGNGNGRERDRRGSEKSGSVSTQTESELSSGEIMAQEDAKRRANGGAWGEAVAASSS